MSGQAHRFQTILEALAHWAAVTPDAEVLLAPGRGTLTYLDLERSVLELVTRLRDAEVRSGRAVVVILPEGPDLAVATLAAMAIGAAVPLPWPQGSEAFTMLRNGGRIGAVVASSDAKGAIRELTSDVAPVFSVRDATSSDANIHGAEGFSARNDVLRRSPDDTALILRSSGTTGRAKLVPRSHRAIMSLCRDMIDGRALTAGDRCLCLARGWYSQGINAVMTAIATGGSVIVISDLNLAALPGWLESLQPTYIATTPAVLRAIAAARPAVREAMRSAPLRAIHTAAGPLSSAEVERLELELGAPILNGYGMTEASRIAGERFPRSDRAPGSVGYPWCEVRIMDGSGEDVAQGKAGEIVVRGERVFAGYLDDPEANAIAFWPGGWFRTGDTGYLDVAGRLFVTARQGESINRGGEKIAPDSIDASLLEHPAVAEAAAFAVPDERLGEDVVAAVVLKPGTDATPRELRRWLLDRLGLQRSPRRFWFLPALPRTDTGKVRRGELTRMWAQQ